VDLRGPLPEDANFILSSWLKSHRDVGDVSAMTNPVYFGGYRDECVEKLKRADVTIACSPRDPDCIYGWVCSAPGGVHYIYVKHAYRQRGIAKILAPGGTRWVSTMGRQHRDWARKYGFEYDPYTWKTMPVRPEAA
jgi:GNAT superfamily N-acetyltransferase